MSAAVISVLAPASAVWRAISASVAVTGTPVTAPPRRMAPSAIPAHAGTFGACNARTSPGPKPPAASRAATRSARSDNCV
jgi:hypothetical protein